MRNLALRLAPVALLLGALVPAHASEPAPEKTQRTIDLAICLDTSGSMEGLIDAARRKIWAIVNDLALAKPTPRLRVALLAYGGESYPAADGHVAVQTAFTEDLDLVSSRLFALRAKGSVELVGRVLHTARTTLDWQAGTDALKLIVVAGNESADQDQVHRFRDVCRSVIADGIMVDALYCVRPNESVAGEWQEIARLTDGHYAAIDPNGGTIDLASPYDERLTALSQGLNSTYVAFGAAGEKGQAEQRRQDVNAEGLAGGAAAQRAAAKSSKLYWNAWCLVDATRRGSVDLAELDDEELPEVLRGKTVAEKKAYLDAKWEEREAIKAKIAELQKQRQAWIDKELKERALDEDKSFDAAIRKALREQAAAKGYTFEEEDAEG